MTRVVRRARLGIFPSGHGEIVGYGNIRALHVGLDAENFPALWWESTGAAAVGDDYDVLTIAIVHDGQFHDLGDHHYVGTIIHDHVAQHVYARTTTHLGMGIMRIVADTGDAA